MNEFSAVVKQILQDSKELTSFLNERPIPPFDDFLQNLVNSPFRPYQQEEIDFFFTILQFKELGIISHSIFYSRTPLSLFLGCQQDLNFNLNICQQYFSQIIKFQEVEFFQKFDKIPGIKPIKVHIPDITGGLGLSIKSVTGHNIQNFTYTNKNIINDEFIQNETCKCLNCLDSCLKTIGDEFDNIKPDTNSTVEFFSKIFYNIRDKQCNCKLKGMLLGFKNHYDFSFSQFKTKKKFLSFITNFLNPYIPGLLLETENKLMVETEDNKSISNFFKLNKHDQIISQRQLENLCSDKIKSYYKIRQVTVLRRNSFQILSECSIQCQCSCERIVSSSSEAQTYLKQTEHGVGIFLTQSVACGEFVCLYTGKLICNQEADNVGMKQDAIRNSYLYDIINNLSKNDITVDAKEIGGLGRFINHSKNANLATYHVFFGNTGYSTFGKVGIPSIVFFANRNIRQDEELFIDYEYNLEYKEIYPWAFQ